jgi:hypothetical protein
LSSMSSAAVQGWRIAERTRAESNQTVTESRRVHTEFHRVDFMALSADEPMPVERSGTEWHLY